jgi:hypothetical protein
MINLIKLQPSLSIVLVAFHATEIQCLKQGLRSYALLRSAKCQFIQILIILDYFNTGCMKKRNLGISQEIDIVLRTKDFRRLGI